VEEVFEIALEGWVRPEKRRRAKAEPGMAAKPGSGKGDLTATAKRSR
jgi:hypothetical protein